MLAIVKGTLGASVGEAATVDVDHDGLVLFTTARYPDIQSQTVFIICGLELEEIREGSVSLRGQIRKRLVVAAEVMGIRRESGSSWASRSLRKSV